LTFSAAWAAQSFSLLRRSRFATVAAIHAASRAACSAAFSFTRRPSEQIASSFSFPELTYLPSTESDDSIAGESPELVRRKSEAFESEAFVCDDRLGMRLGVRSAATADREREIATTLIANGLEQVESRIARLNVVLVAEENVANATQETPRGHHLAA